MGRGIGEGTTGRISIFTRKQVGDVIGNVIWLICGDGKPRKYGLCARFEADTIDQDDDDEVVTIVSGKGRPFRPEIPLNEQPWFKRFLHDFQNFSLGFREIKAREYIDAFEALARSRSEGRATGQTAGLGQQDTRAKFGAGFGDPEMNSEVEDAAVRAVTAYYVNNKWDVHDVSKEKRGYDLRCVKRGKEEHVEVKGIRGERPSFIITAGEVKAAEQDPRFVLHIVTSALSRAPQHSRYTGVEMLQRFDLKPISYQASLQSMPQPSVKEHSRASGRGGVVRR